MPAVKPQSTNLYLTFIGLVLVVPLLAISVVQLEGPRIRREAQAELNAIGQLKARQIESWLAERQGDAAALMASKALADDLEHWFALREPAAESRLARHVETLQRAYGYQVEWLPPQPESGRLAPHQRALLAAAVATRRPQLSEPYQDEHGQVWLDLVVPLFKTLPSQASRLAGTGVLRIETRSFLFPLIQTWPTPSPSAETLLIRRDGDYVLFLNKLRHRKDTALSPQLPLDAPELLAPAIRGGMVQPIESRDYRGIAVLAATHSIQGTPWMLLAKVDRDEVMRPLYTLVAWVSVVSLLAILGMSLVLLRLWRQQQQTSRLEILSRAGERDRLLSLFYDLSFMGMAIIDPDDEHWLHVNDRLCQILGYSHDALLTKTHWKQLIHRDDLPGCMTEHQRMLAGETDGYQMELRLLHKDGSPIDTALAVKCARNPDGRVEYIVETVRDISDRKQAEASLLASEQRFRLLATATFEGIAISEQGLVVDANERLQHMLGYSREELIGMRVADLLLAEEREQILDNIRQNLESHIECSLIRKDGLHIRVEAHGQTHHDEGREIRITALRDITEHKWAEDLIRRTQTLLYSFIEQAPISIAMFNRNMNYLAYSQRWLSEYGRGYQDLLGRNHYRVHPDLDEVWKAVHRRGLAGETVRNDEDHWQLADGSEYWLRWAVVPWRDENGEVGGIIISTEDITERKRIEVELSDSRARLAGIIDSAMDAIITMDSEQRIHLFNPAAEQMFGYQAMEMIGESIDRLIPAPLRQRHNQHIRHFAEEGITSRSMTSLGELHGLRCDGTEFPLEASISKVHVAGEQIFTVILRDVTARKQAEQALRDSDEDLNRAQAVGHIGSWRLDVRRNELTWSKENHRIFEVPEGTPMTYEFFLACVHPEDRAYVDRAWQDCLRGGSYDIEHRLQVEGKVKWVRERATLEFSAEGELLGGFGITQDITDRKLAEQALRDSEERFQLAAEIGRSGTWDWNLMSGEVIWSRGHYEILGYRAGEVAPGYQSWIERVHPEDRAQIEAGIRHCRLEHTDYVAEFRVLWPDGSVHWMSARGRYEYGEDDSCQRMLGVMADITSLKQAELALREADQRKDEFLAMLAHELRNPLAPIRNAAHVLGQLEVNEPRVRWVQDIIERQVTHLTHLVDELLDVSRIASGKVSLKKVPIALSDLLRQTCEAVQPLMAAKGHHLTQQMPDSPVQLEGDPVRLTQVLQNLLNNAAKYTPDGGRIELLARLRGPEIQIEVRDNGMGMPADLLPRAFDLFRQGERTLDRSQGGLGIGLTLVRRLVELHGGRVEAQSPGPGLGSTISVWLPVSVQAAPPAAPADQRPAGKAAKLRVLVVDDDPVVNESMVVFLELEGHQVRSADSGAAAMRLWQEFRPQVVLLDIGLPGQDGYEVARQIRLLPDKVQLVAVSGYGHAEAMERSRQAGFDRHLIKPVDPEFLSALLAEIGGRV